jgi:hypothetical protein
VPNSQWRRVGVLLAVLVAVAVMSVTAGAGRPGGQLETQPGAAKAGHLLTKSDIYKRTRDLLPEQFLEYETKRFIVLSDAAPSWSRRQTALLDRTYHQFNRFARRLDVKPLPLRHKLVCVLFQEHQDYRRFARSSDGVTADWISGYYSPKNDRIVFYNIETNPDFAEAIQVSKSAERIAKVEGHTPAARGVLREEYQKAAIATVVHEAVHQLAFHTRIQSPQIQNPLWLSEGLATAFETDRPNRSFGPDQEYDLREQQFTELLDEGKLIPLRKLVTYSNMPNNDDDTIAAVYHQSYSLVTWMCRFRKSEMRNFLDALRSERPGRPSARRQLQIFEKAFGKVGVVEKAWLRHVEG